MAAFEELKSDRALVCQREYANDEGTWIIWYVCLDDGHLLDCGYGRTAQARAERVATAINALPVGERP